jgi:L(+)-tartrate dehydratase beta subunit
MSEYHFKVPLKDEDIKRLRIGDMVYFSGEAWTTRSRVQKAVFDEGWKLPFSIEERNLLIHTGPVIKEDNGEMKIISFAPTTSVRFEKWGPRSVREWRLKAIVGKATMGEKTRLAMKEHVCIHASPIGLTTNLFLDRLTIKNVYWKKEFGSIESAWIIGLEDYGPLIVDIDCYGNNYFDEIEGVIQNNKKAAYQYLNIPDDFQYTRLS